MSVTLPHFLIVEPDDDHADLIEAAFQQSNGRKTTERVRTGRQTLARARGEGPYAGQGRPDVILIDWRLPDLDTADVLGSLRRVPEWRDIPVVVLTDPEAPCDGLNAYELKADAFLAKPLGYDPFFEMVEALSAYGTRWTQAPEPVAAAPVGSVAS